MARKISGWLAVEEFSLPFYLFKIFVAIIVQYFNTTTTICMVKELITTRMSHKKRIKGGFTS
jgi:hypothetical protein